MLRLATCEHVSQMTYSVLSILAVLCLLFVFGYALEGLKEEEVFQLKAIICRNIYELLLNQFSQKTIISVF